MLSCLKIFFKFNSFLGETDVRTNYVYVSNDRENSCPDPFWYSDPRCYFQPETVQCYNLGFVLSTIIKYHLTWINVIYVEDKQGENSYADHINTEDNPDVPITITICCKSLICTFSPILSIITNYYKRYLVIKITNVLFLDSLVILSNVNVQFRNVQFVNTTVTDELLHSVNTIQEEVSVEFYSVKFSSSHDADKSSMIFDKCLNINLFIVDSHLDNFGVAVNTRNVWIKVLNTRNYLKMSKVSILASNKLYLFVSNLKLKNQSTQGVPLFISSKTLHVEINDSVVQETLGGITIRTTEHAFGKIRAQIVNSNFENNRKHEFRWSY